MKKNRLNIIGNGFDLAHGLKTKYSDFIDWLLCDSYNKYHKDHYFEDQCFLWGNKNGGISQYLTNENELSGDVVIKLIKGYPSCFKINSSFLRFLIDELYTEERWVDIEANYFQRLMAFFSEKHVPNKMDSERNHKDRVTKKISQLNKELEYLAKRLEEYLSIVNSNISSEKFFDNPRANIIEVFQFNKEIKTMFLNFNYTDTLRIKNYADKEEMNFIHGQLGYKDNPIVLGYGDENTSGIQILENSGVNEYIRKLKSFAYLKAPNYKKLLSFIDSSEFEVNIVGHSCGITDRALLKEIFEHKNCVSIRVFFYEDENGSDNFEETTIEIARHFSDKQLMRRKLIYKNEMDFIPQIKSAD